YQVVHPGEVRDIQCQTRGAPWTAADNLVTITRKYTVGSFAGQLQSVQHTDGTAEIYLYSTNATQKTTTVLSGVPDMNGTGIVAGTKTVTVTGTGGQVLSSATYEVQPA